MSKLIFLLLFMGSCISLSAQFNIFKKDKSEEIKLKNDSIVTYISLNKKGDTSEIISYLNGRRHGYSMDLNSDDEKTIEFYENGKRNGLKSVYFPNGKLKSETNYSQGKQEGLKRTFYENGSMRFVGFLEDGIETGKITYYHPNGNPHVVRIWNDSIKNKLEKQYSYYENGNLKDSANFSSLIFNGKFHSKVLDGKKYTYSSDGHEAMTEFHKGFSKGFSTYKSPNGKLIWESTMLNDSTQQFYYYDNEGGLMDSLTVQFWKPFKNPLITRDSFKYYQLNNYGHFDYISNKERYEPNAIVEEYFLNGNLKYRADNEFFREYYPNGKTSRIGKGSARGYHFQWEKQYRYTNNHLVGESFLSGTNGRREPLINNEYKANKDTLTTIQVFSYGTNPQCLLRSGYLNGKHEWISFNYMQQRVKLQKKSDTKYLLEIEFRRYYKNILRKLFKQDRKKRYIIKSKENGLTELGKFLNAETHSLVDKNGTTILSFDLIDSTIVKNLNFNLPNGKTLFRIIESDGNHPSAALIERLGFQVNRNDSIAIQESIFPNKDTIFSFYVLNGKRVYTKHYDECSYIDPKSGTKTRIKLYENKKVKSKQKESKYHHSINYYKNGNIRFEACTEEDPDGFKFVSDYYVNGNPKLKHFYHENAERYERLSFRRNGSLQIAYTRSKTSLYNRKGDLIAHMDKNRISKEGQVFVRIDNQKELIFNNGKRQYNSINFIKNLSKRSWKWLEGVWTGLN